MLVSFLRISVSLCCTSGWSNTWTLAGMAVPSSLRSCLENGAVAVDRRAADRRRATPCASSRPAAHVPPSRMHASGSPARRARRARSGASSSISATVSARHSTTSSLPTSQRRARSAALRNAITPVSSSRPPLRYSGSAGQLIAAGDVTPAHSNGSNSEYASHCDSLWNGTQPARRARRRPHADAATRRRAATPSSVLPVSQIGPSMSSSARRIASRRRVLRASRVSVSKSAPGAPARRRPRRCSSAPRPAAAAARRGRRAPPADCRRAPGTASPSVGRVDVGQALRIDAQRIGGVAENAPSHERAEARDAEALRAREALAGRRLDVAPRRAGAGIEQHADDGEVDLRARALRGERPASARRARRGDRRRRPRSGASGCDTESRDPDSGGASPRRRAPPRRAARGRCEIARLPRGHCGGDVAQRSRIAAVRNSSAAPRDAIKGADAGMLTALPYRQPLRETPARLPGCLLTPALRSTPATGTPVPLSRSGARRAERSA